MAKKKPAKKGKKNKKAESEEEDYDPFENFVEEEDDSAYGSEKEEIKKYSLLYKIRHFFDLHHKKPEDHSDEEADESGEFQQTLMGDSAEIGETQEGPASPEKSLLFKLRWYEWLGIVVEIAMLIYVILVVFRIVPIF